MKRKFLIATVGLLCLMLVGCSLPELPIGESAMSVTSIVEEAEPDCTALYTDIMKLVSDYQSYEWDGKERLLQEGRYIAQVKNHFIMICEPAKLPNAWLNTLVNVDWPPDRNVDERYQTALFSNQAGDDCYYWLSANGVQTYERGVLLEDWRIDSIIKGESRLLQFGGYAPCVYTDDQILYCAPNGRIEVLVDGLVDAGVAMNKTDNLLAINDGELSEYSCSRTSNVIEVYPIAQDVTSAVVIADAATIFSRAGKTYLVQLRDYETCYELINGNPEVAYRYCLGQESPEFYLDEYMTLRDIAFTNLDNKKCLSDDEVIRQLLEKYCGLD